MKVCQKRNLALIRITTFIIKKGIRNAQFAIDRVGDSHAGVIQLDANDVTFWNIFSESANIDLERILDFRFDALMKLESNRSLIKLVAFSDVRIVPFLNRFLIQTSTKHAVISTRFILLIRSKIIPFYFRRFSARSEFYCLIVSGRNNAAILLGILDCLRIIRHDVRADRRKQSTRILIVRIAEVVIERSGESGIPELDRFAGRNHSRDLLRAPIYFIEEPTAILLFYVGIEIFIIDIIRL